MSSLPPAPPSSAPADDGRPQAPRASPEGQWLFGQYRFEPASRHLHADGRVRELDARAAAALDCLLRHAGSVVPRALLIAEAWPDADAVLDSAVSKTMRRLRTAVGDRSGHVLQTVYGEGYRLALPAVLLPRAPGPQTLRAGEPPASTPLDPRTPEQPQDPPPHPPAAPGPHPAPSPHPDPRPRSARGAGWQRLPWIIAAVATLAALALAWLVLHPAATA